MAKCLFTFFIATILSLKCFASVSDFSWREEDKRKGYIEQVSQDHEDIGTPMFIVDNPEAGELSLRERLFDQTLTSEFSHKYESIFGRTEAEVFYTTSSVSDTYLYQGHSYTQQEYFDQQRSFSLYMIRRMAEYHFDHSAQNSPVTKQIYALKEKARNVDVAISPDFKINAKYTLSGNDIQVDVVNPYLISKVDLLLETQNTIFDIGRKINIYYQVDGYYTIENGTIQAVARRRLTDLASISLTVSPNHLYDTVNRESFYLAGLSWVF